MSNSGPPPAKRTRYGRLISTYNNNNNIKRGENAQSKIYMTRNRAKTEKIVIDNFELIEPRRKQNRSKKLMDLNDNCLLAIFEHLSIKTLCNIADTCVRMNDITRYYFRIKHTRFDCASLIEDDIIQFDEIKRLFSQFGDLITSLDLSTCFFAQSTDTSFKLLQLVKQHCTHLNTLKLEDISIPKTGFHEWQRLFQPLEALSIENCEILEFDKGIGDMNNLKVLKMQNFGCQWNETIGRHFNKLEEAAFYSCYDLTNYSIKEFVKANQLLKRLTVIECELISTLVFESIGQLKQLEEFEFHPFLRRSNELYQIDMMNLVFLKNLKVLNLNCSKFSVAKLIDGFIKNTIKIEHLELAYGPMDDETYANINKLNTIKVLKLNEMFELSECQIIQFAKQLKHLEEFWIKTKSNITRYGLKTIVKNAVQLSCLKIDAQDLHLDEYTYNEIINTIRKREKNIKLTITIYGNGNQISVPNCILYGINEKWISAKELNRNYNYIFPQFETDVVDEDIIEFSDDDFDEFDSDMEDEDNFEHQQRLMFMDEEFEMEFGL